MILNFLSANIKIKFLIFFVDVDVSTVEARAFGVLLDIPVPFPLEKPDVCSDSDSGINCPLKKDQEVEYKTKFFLEKKTPTVWNFSIDIPISFYLYLYIVYI